MNANRANAILMEMSITQLQAAEDLGVHSPQLSMLAHGKHVVSADGASFTGLAERFADYLGMPAEWLWADPQEDFGTHASITPGGLLFDTEDDCEPIDEVVANAELRALMLTVMGRVCTERQRFVLAHRFGLQTDEYPESKDAETLAQIGRRLGLVRESIRTTEREALIRIRAHLRALSAATQTTQEGTL